MTLMYDFMMARPEEIDDDRVVSVLLGQLTSPTDQAWFVLGYDADDNPILFTVLPDHRQARTAQEAAAIVEGLLATHGRSFARRAVPQFWSGAWVDRTPGIAGQLT
jgi:hypothetical protein